MDDEATLYQGRCGEKVLEEKANGMDNVGTLSGFVVAFGIGFLLELSEEDFSSGTLYTLYMVMLTLATCTGVFSLLAMTFVSTKIRRLLGRSLWYWGEDGTPDMLDKVMPDWRQKVVVRLGKPCFCARAWYYSVGKKEGLAPELLYMYALKAFGIQFILFMVAVAVKILDASPYSSLAAVLVALLAISTFLSFWLPFTAKALKDLN
mmetsp:Transcript_1583/g.2468  ORF Transcript_1583/g.2468 Transcript_1583/m.2468 type:complete len:206 (+) Transcript_1583:24-641(+)|eukprot:CAMPEP_0194578488 /NCGR_PEP_ID=MMETSP0292-20121207/12884_1 /TAXON_ID=39354 /ORGANISM="Heterosigma akashiwo, Strain CCMP2393" /LENGTH=205 /DNA_ID=CAMNT_0039431149 /DNA_START=144 /DNA_END=761 /DNA_ORIENTATION=-